MLFIKILQKVLKQGFLFLWIEQTTIDRKEEESCPYMKDELGGKIIKEFVGLRAKTYIHLIDQSSEGKKVNVQKEKS